MGSRTRKRPHRPDQRRRKTGYTAGEWFMVALGIALVVLVVGMVVTAVLE